MSTQKNDYVYRAIHPKRVDFICLDGSIAPAAFIDPKGLSVELGSDRTDTDVVNHIRKAKLQGKIAKISVRICDDADITIYDDKAKNEYHRLLLNKPYNPNENNSFVMLAANISRLLDDLEVLFT